MKPQSPKRESEVVKIPKKFGALPKEKRESEKVEIANMFQ